MTVSPKTSSKPGPLAGRPLLSRAFVAEHRERLPVTTVGPLDAKPERVIQFGEGNFLRAFAEWHFQELARQGLFHGRVVIVQPLETGSVDALNAQDGVYTLVRRGLAGGRAVEETDIITIVGRGLDPYAHFEDFVRCAGNPDLRFMISNTTEAGIAYRPVPRPEGRCPETFPAKVAWFLYERHNRFAGAPDKGLIVLPCELIEENGAALLRCVLRHAADWGLGPEFAGWVERSNHFCDTLVDRIVPGHPRDEMEALEAKLGFADPMLVASEIFHLWVIRGDPEVKRELPFEAAGLNVVWAESLAPFRTLKVRILNGAHTAFALAAFLAGADTVREGLEDPLVGGFVEKALYDEIIPTLDVPREEAEAYAATVLERFKNPFIKHVLLGIALNSVAKFKVRVLPSVLRFVEKYGEAPDALALSLAALIFFYRGTRDGARTSSGRRRGEPYRIQDDDAVLDFFAEREALYAGDGERLCRETLGRADFWGLDLTPIPGFLPAVARHFEVLRAEGVREALRRVASRRSGR